MIDMHVHILPGTDDGAGSERETEAMMRRAREAGITYMVCTPHVYSVSDQQRHRAVFPAGRQIAHAHGVGMALGCEFNYRALAQLAGDLSALGAFCLGPTPCILLEFSDHQQMPGWESTLSEILDEGFLPIIAHPERCRYIQRDLGVARALSDLGCELQVDAGGLMADLFGAERRTARKLLKEGLVSYIASDAHKPADYDVYEKAYRLFRDEWPEENRLKAMLQARRRRNTR